MPSLKCMLDSLDDFVKEPQNRKLLQIVKSMRNGIVYGGRLRFAHSLVINLLFKRKVPLFKRLSQVLRMTKDHGLILALYALVYNMVILILNEFVQKRPINEFIAGCIGGGLIYGNQTSKLNHAIAHQITLYCSARVVLGAGKLVAYKAAKYTKEHRNLISKQLRRVDKKHLRGSIQNLSWLVFSSLSWGSVMYLHRFYPSFLQHGLESSMKYIYDDHDWSDFRTLFGV